ncbi:DNA packaging protein [Rhodopseudomonas palustris]|uniref:DNA packaging protein n=1 Tax=Rhodopseudomonas palustris TaxID=1076 RepID=A0A323UK50_RHOPL|nr:DNA packaging protein [Rhodopseudomonas palustris]PZA12751.1 DNA packaging protein [Rhodopseudomonas palustris]
MISAALDTDRPIGSPRELSKSGFANFIGVSPGRVSQMIRDGLPVESSGKIDVARGQIWFQENVDQRRSVAQRQSELPLVSRNKESHRDRLLREQADNAALKNQILRRDYVKATEVEARWSDVLRRLRSKILAVPSRVRQANPHLTAQDVTAFDAELRAALEDLAGPADA